MITKLVVENFQSHKKSTLELHPGVNCVIGSSDVGKTALLRALRWLIWNRPSGDAFRSSWGGDTSVSIDIDGTEVIRWRDNSSNCYLVNGVQLSAVRTDVPDEVRKVLTFDEINLQRQFDGPFLLNDSPGEVSAHFNRISKLDTIDNANRAVQSSIRDLQQQIASNDTQATELQAQLAHYDGIDEIDSNLSNVELEEKSHSALVDEAAKITKVVSSIHSLTQEITKLTEVTRLSNLVDVTLSLVSSHQTTLVDLSNLKQCLTQIATLRRNQDDFRQVVLLSDDVSQTLNQIEMHKSIEANRKSLLSTVSAIGQMSTSLTNGEQSVIKLQEEFDTAFPDVCPLCGSRRRGDYRRAPNMSPLQTR